MNSAGRTGVDVRIALVQHMDVQDEQTRRHADMDVQRVLVLHMDVQDEQ